METSPLHTHRPPTAAVVVATRDRGEKIVPLLNSLLASEVVDFEVVIVDQSVSSATAEAVQPFLSDARFAYTRSDTKGLSRARNIGAALTCAPYILITDDDCTVPPNWIEAMTEPFGTHSAVGVVFCTVEAVPVTEPGLTPAITFEANRLLTRPVSAWRAAWGGLSLGAGMAIRRSTFAEVGGFDELLGAGAHFGAAEDNDFSWRALLRGWHTFQHADVAVLHDGFRSINEVRELVRRDLHGVGGAIAKYFRIGQWQIAWLLSAWLIRFGVLGPAADVVALRRPRGFRRPYLLLHGLYEGLRTPLDRRQLMYVRNTAVESSGASEAPHS